MDASTLNPRPRIRTPDQRLRVFVSSTLKELATERRIARQAIERIGAAPVMFELGARPHPPRDLYRAYLEQSDIFVGLYWERYGWVAPGETVSGLEDEYNLAPPDMPRLIYIKETGGAREPRLDGLLDRIRADDRASFTHFPDARALGRLLLADLAILLAERFDRTRVTAAVPSDAPHVDLPGPSAPATLPTPLTKLFGREQEARDVAALLRSPDVRLVTLTGPGGIGKTRLALEAARHAAPDFPDGVQFVPLAPVETAALVPDAIARALGVRNPGDLPLESKLVTALRDRRMLLVLDNFEHLLPAAPVLSELLEGAPSVRMLVTSRALLRLSGEHALAVEPLPVPAVGEAPSEIASVALFVDRARAVKPDFELTESNAGDVGAIVRRLDGVPLALELAAARTRLLSPAALLARLGRQLPVLVGGERDLPPRQQTVRSTIEWSTRLLTEHARALLWRLGVFAGRFSLSSAEAIADDGEDVLGPLEALVDSSLVRQQDRDGRTCFLLLATVREYALEQLDLEGRTTEVRSRHARHYGRWARELGRRLNGRRQREVLAELADERDNLQSAVRFLLDAGDWDTVADLSWSLYRYWWLGSQFGEVGAWMDELLASDDAVSERTRAIALCLTTITRFRSQPPELLLSRLTESLALFSRTGTAADEAIVLEFLAFAHVLEGAVGASAAVQSLERSGTMSLGDRGGWGEVMGPISLGRLGLLQGDLLGALGQFSAALAVAEDRGDELMLPMILHHLGWTRLELGDVPEAKRLMDDALTRSLELEHDLGIAYALEGFTIIAAAADEPERAGAFRGAAEAVRERSGIVSITDPIFRSELVEQLRSGDRAIRFEQGRAEGRRMSREEVRGLAQELAASGDEPPSSVGGQG